MPLEREVRALKLREDWEFYKKYKRHPDHDQHEPIPSHASAPLAPHAPIEDHEPEDLEDDVLYLYNGTSSENIHSAIKNAGKSIPRYLFRAWSADSGGSSRLNTIEDITPLAFLKGSPHPSNIFDINAADLFGLITGHLGGDLVKTPFSSWSYSLPFALSMVASKRNAHSSVINTHRLKPENHIFHWGAHDIGAVSIAIFGEEFLVFGVVEGSAHQAVPFKQVEKYMGGLPRWGYLPEEMKRVGRISCAKDFGKQFGREFELPMAICFLAANSKLCEDAKVKQELIRDCSILTAWAIDFSFPTLSAAARGHAHEAVRASKAMAGVATLLRATGSFLSITKTKAAKKPPKQHATERDGQTEVNDRFAEAPGENEKEAREQMTGDGWAGQGKHLKKTSRMPRDVYRLYIDMVGYDDHNEALER